ncbi:Hypothetical predicted protein [Octopus vulgaris]|uniref:Uncharacterized protein n=1 Tax=Octopus vulgaris TaxID=6645 RepID=A0AA36BD96_OCTVU|nr:Hypothetical predicted protein [Octopus vulgaris]
MHKSVSVLVLQVINIVYEAASRKNRVDLAQRYGVSPFSLFLELLGVLKMVWKKSLFLRNDEIAATTN